MELHALKDQVERIEKALIQMTETVKTKFDKGLPESEIRELSDKITEIQKELKERKHQFEVTKSAVTDAEKTFLNRKQDELLIYRALCRDPESSKFDHAAWDKIKAVPEYADVFKAFGDVDAMTTTGTGTGAEWIPEAFSATLMEEVWLNLEIAALFRRIPMPASKYTLPFSPGRIIPKAALEGGTVAKVKGKTDEIVFAAQKIMSIVEMTDEFEQDSIVPALEFLRSQLIEGFALAQETMCLNGSKTNTTIYAAGHTPDSTDIRGLVNGIRHDAMAKGAKVDFGAASGFTADNLRALRTQLKKYGKRPGDLAYIITMDQYNKCLGFAGYQALYQYAGAVTATGELGRLDNIPLIVTELLPEAGVTSDAADGLAGLNASGIFDGTTMTKGTCVLVNRNGYMFGDRKEVTTELWRNPMNGSTNLIGHQRLDFEHVGSDTSKFAAVGYNI